MGSSNSLPLYKNDDQVMQLMQTNWKSRLDPVLSNPFVNGNLLTGIILANGSTTFPHLLSRQMQGWTIVDQNAPAAIYRSKPLSPTTLTLTSSAATVVSLWVF